MKIYLDTSVISALFDSKNPERQALTKTFFDALEPIDPFISEITVIEIERTPNLELRNNMKDFIASFTILPLTEDVEKLFQQYLDKGAIPDKFQEDAYHIAIAVVNEIDFLLSWNFKHIVKRKTKDIVRMVNTLNNLKQIEIMTPAELF